VSRSTGLPRPPMPRAPSVWNAPRDLAHRSRVGDTASCVSTGCGNLLGQRRASDSPCGSSRRHDARCVEPTSAFSRFRTSTRASLVPVASQRLRAPRDRGDRLSHVSAIRFGGPHVLCMSSRWAFLFPSRCVRTDPLTSLSPLSRVRTRSRGLHTHESRRDRPQLARVNDSSW